MKTIISIIIAIIFSISAMAAPSKAEAWVWLVAKKLVKSVKPAPKPKKSWWESEGKNSRGWTNGDKSDPDWKQLNYREKDWYN